LTLSFKFLSATLQLSSGNPQAYRDFSVVVIVSCSKFTVLGKFHLFFAHAQAVTIARWQL